MKPEPVVYANGKWLTESTASVPFTDAAFLYGDGLFETIRFQNRKLFKPEKHLERLKTGLQVLHMHLQHENSALIELLKECVSKNTIQTGLLRLMITRGEVTGTPWTYTGPAGIYIGIRPLSDEGEAPVKVLFLKEEDYPIIRYTPAIKSMNYVGNLLAKKEAEGQDAFEPVFINRRGIVTECAIRNIFFIKDEVLMTPSLDLGVLPGVMRDTVLEIARRSGLTVLESYIPYSEINQMSEAFITSTGIGLRPCYWDGWESDFRITRELSKSLQNEIGRLTALQTSS